MKKKFQKHKKMIFNFRFGWKFSNKHPLINQCLKLKLNVIVKNEIILCIA